MSSKQFPDALVLGAGDLAYDEAHGWTNYVKAVLWALRQNGMAMDGYDIEIDSDLWKGGGLSSSAALEMAVARAVCAIEDIRWDPMAMALLCQKAENQFIGVQCGIMDQAAVALACQGHALFLHCQSLKYQLPALNFRSASFVIAHSSVERSLKDGSYNARRRGCEESLEILRKSGVSVANLVELDPEILERHRNDLGPERYDLVSHVVGENRRSFAGCQAMSKGDAGEFGRLMLESHRSLQNQYRVSCPELDCLVQSAMRLPGVYGGRMTGAGFGGCTVNLVETSRVEEFCELLPRHYKAATGLDAKMLACESAPAASLV